MRGYPQRVLLGLLAFIAIAAIVGCPHPAPTPVGPPDASDAAPLPPMPPAPSCADACERAALGCPGSRSVCLPICNRLGAAYARCVNAATTCEGPTGLGACDPLHDAPQGKPSVNGR